MKVTWEIYFQLKVRLQPKVRHPCYPGTVPGFHLSSPTKSVKVNFPRSMLSWEYLKYVKKKKKTLNINDCFLPSVEMKFMIVLNSTNIGVDNQSKAFNFTG